MTYAATHTIEELAGNFSLFSDWEERYRYLIDLGRTLPDMDAALRTPQTLVKGCTSQVWMVLDIKDGHLHIQADSDAHIVRGLIALLLAAYQGKTLEEAKGVDIEAQFKAIGLEQNLSPNRRSGFFAMVERIKAKLQA